VSEQPQIELRQAVPADEAAVLPMMHALAEQPPALPFDEDEIRGTFRLFLSRPQFGRFWLIGHAGDTVGYIILTLGFSFEYRGHDAFIDELYIAPEFRRRGFAAAAMQRLEACARELGVTAVHLEVDPANEPALELYRRIGYIDHDRRLMTKWLIFRP
jgi:ribosomal protein S18 acetylase RimI-like enzyme